MLLIDVEKHKLVIGNKAICKMLSCKREKITNLRIKDVLPQETSIHIIEQAEKKMSKMASSAYNVPVKKNDGNILFADITSVPLTFANKKYIITIFRETFSNEIKSTRHQNASADSCEYPHLTATEINVLKLIVNGMGNKEIARLLSRSQKTIENHRAHLMKKLGVHNSVELIRRAIAIGLVNMKVELQQENVT
ncbi:LuxR C-terminal-related transcriptional regulator [Planctomycetota bacterium]